MSNMQRIGNSKEDLLSKVLAQKLRDLLRIGPKYISSSSTKFLFYFRSLKNYFRNEIVIFLIANHIIVHVLSK